MLRIFFIISILLFANKVNALIVTVTVGSGGNGFNPSTFTINPDDTVKWVWSAGFHNTSSFTLPSTALPWQSNISSNQPTFMYVPKVSGLYRYTCTYHSGMDGQFFVTGCNYPSKPKIASLSNYHCQGDSVTLHVVPQEGSTYQWTKSNVTLSHGNNNSYKATISGLYKIVVNRCGVDSISDPFTLTMNEPPAASFTHSYNGLSYTFINSITSPGPYDFLWKFSDGSPDQTTANAFQAFTSSENVTVTLKVTNTQTTCSDTFALVVEQIALDVKPSDPQPYTIFYDPGTKIIQINASSEVSMFLSTLHGNTIHIPIQKNNNLYYMDVNALTTGMYFVHISNSKYAFIEKIIILN